MAIYHLSMKPVARGSGRSAVAAAAYRAAEKLTNERDGLVHDFRDKQGVEHAEIVLPDGVSAEWAKDRSALWNAAEFAENRKDARVAREFEIALPHELSSQQRIGLAREFAQGLADRYGTAVDFAVHHPHVEGDVRNYHAHVLMTTRTVGPEGLGAKTHIERANKELLPEGLPTSQMQIRDIRQSFEHMANEHLARAGLEIRIDHRSHSERGLEIEPTGHMGVHATQIDRQGGEVSRTRLDDEAARRNADLIREKPEEVLTIITGEKSVFDRHDVARTLHRYINDDAQAFQNAFAAVMASKALVELQAERANPEMGVIELARYSTREMVGIESAMADRAEVMKHARSHGVDRHHVVRSIEKQDKAIRSSAGDRSAALSREQRQAIEYITGPERIAAVVGYAGAGKSTMLAAAREAWERQGYTVHGAALSGKAAEGLEESSGIASRTLASWEYRWQSGADRRSDRHQLGRRDVFVIDEAGMVGSRQLARFIGEAERTGAKIVLVGDHEQLQAIGAGAPFRAIAEQIGHAELSEIRRQRADWQREASVSFATHTTAEGLAAYREHGDIRFAETRDGARAEIVRDYLADLDARPEGSRVAMAHRRVDVRALNDEIRSTLQDSNQLGRGEEGGEVLFQTNDGKRAFAPGDRFVFLQNDRGLDVKNGTLGEVLSVEPDAIQVRLNGKSAGVDAREVTVSVKDYQSFDHGYATTIHKNQGSTVDHAFVMASGSMDRHLTYVAMTRHRDGVELYASAEEFSDRKAGRLVEHGTAPYENTPGNRDSYFVTLENDKGEKHTTWGVDIKRAMSEAKPEIGAKIGLEHGGSETVRLPDGQTVERNSWKVHSADELAFKQLEERLSRSGVKETTLDYTRDLGERRFAERRGMAEQPGICSEITLAATRGQEREDNTARKQPQTQRPSPFAGLKLRRGAPPKVAPAQYQADRPRNQPQTTEPPKRRMFDGLRLNADRGFTRDRGDVSRLLRAERDESLRPMSGFEQSVDRFARALSAVERHDRQGLPVLEAQKSELRQASLGLDQQRPGASRLMISAIQHDPQTDRAVNELSGRERVGQLVAGMDRERALQADPNVRADRLINRWQELQGERKELAGWEHDEARGKVEGQLRQVAGAIERDPQVETIVLNRAQELGIGSLKRDHKITQQMEQQLTRGRRQELER
ncbi:Ti-type conjugative transfer relaxase TraA [Rhizobium sp. PL01]|uniref:Ti-type conjugative transfer relaxase TraA n=1 Tax=Rhizobium sp. PL01 TaxID=3085631 RepID=UPI00298200BF|nr:Ti-type conjugative transfer relaxase TraA [Rhizobium sp. PL01]MDW5318410.1 Ti-type conjugative transfer relaxase TraA [Rhizobium sp. PL01]